jgi:hypothetical protein
VFVCHHSLHNTTIPAADDAFANEQAGSNLQKSYPGYFAISEELQY